MMIPSIRNNVWNEMMNPWEEMFQSMNQMFEPGGFGLPRTDIREAGSNYEVEMELPGVKKEDIHARLENGYLTIQASQNHNREEKDNNGNFIRRERYQGSISRSFYVGDRVQQGDINASFDQGVLHLTIPRYELPQQENGYIPIEG